jgi:hypothetical protein
MGEKEVLYFEFVCLNHGEQRINLSADVNECSLPTDVVVHQEAIGVGTGHLVLDDQLARFLRTAQQQEKAS